MDAATLSSAMGGIMPMAYYKHWLPEIEEAMILADATTLNRAACLLGQVREESVGLRYTQEIGSDAYLQGQQYWPYIGRGFIQCTWESNYASFGAWAKKRKLVTDPNIFVQTPSLLAQRQWAAKTISWYWGQRPINQAADSKDWTQATVLINGGTNGLSSRIAYIQHALSLGDAILPRRDLLKAMGFNSQKELDDHVKETTQKQIEAYLKTPNNGVEKMIAGAFQRAGRWRSLNYDRLYASLARRLASMSDTKSTTKSGGQ